MAKPQLKLYNCRPRHNPGTRSVIAIDLPYAADSEPLFRHLCHLPYAIWLDSGRPLSTLGRYDVFSALPTAQIQGEATELVEQLSQRLAAQAESSTLPFNGGWIGYFPYSSNHAHMRLATPTQRDAPAWFGWYDWAIVVDHHQQNTTLFFLNECAAYVRSQVEQALQTAPRAQQSFTCSAFRADEDQDRYRQSFAKIQAYLQAGDCYQVNYTQRFSADFSGSPAAAYLALRRAVPSPFSAFITTANGAILSISPERFIAIEQRQALTQPIKGTAPRSADAAEDGRLRTELQNSSKNRAENVMIVDLLRNDFSQNCLPHSVKVPQLFELQSFANVHHLVSSVTGELKPGVQHPNFILSCFPGGSITGAPKKRAMEIIDELESQARSIYCGAIGYFSRNQRTDFNIAIRTLRVESARIYAWAGGGIVVDSNAEQEYAECLHKIGALLNALSQNAD